MKLSREEKKALKQSQKQEKLEKKLQAKQEKLQKKLDKKNGVNNFVDETNNTLIENDNLIQIENDIINEEDNSCNSCEQTVCNEVIKNDYLTNVVEVLNESNINLSNDENNKTENLENQEKTKKQTKAKNDVKQNNQQNNDEEININEESENQVNAVKMQDETQPVEEIKDNEPKAKVGFFKKIKNALKKTKESISNKIDQIFGKGELNDEFFEDLEDILISSDLGVETSSDIIENMRIRIKKDKLKTAEEVKETLREVIAEMLDIESEEETYPKVSIIVGVNGVGKTTTIGKLANYYKSQGKKVVVVAGDTFRAAASDQLTEWAKRVDVKIIKQSEGADAASVVFDGISFAKSKGFDVVLVDTAGRLHNKVNLMEELSKVNRVATKNWEEADFERLIVIDATTGQNAVNQVREFNETVDLDGIILTKLDGSAKGGIVVSICNEFEIPVKFVGVGEQMDDLVPFDAKEFVEGII